MAGHNKIPIAKIQINIVMKSPFRFNALLLLLIACAAILASSCSQQSNRNEVDSRDMVESRFHRLDTMLLSTPNTIEINQDSLTRIPVREKKIKAGEPGIIEYAGVQTIEADSLITIHLQHDPLQLTPGSDSLPVPETFRMWKTEENASQDNDSVRRIRTVTVSQPIQVRAEAPRFKDNARCDLRYMDKEHGMASSFIWSILEDRRGIIWMGTARGGLSRFDGSHFTSYTPVEGLNDDIVLSLTEDLKGNIWFGTYKGGIGKYNGKVFTFYGQWEGFSPNPVNGILADSKGNIWAGTWRDGVYMIDAGTSDDSPYETVTRLTTDNGLVSNFIISMMEDRKGNIWIGTRDGLCRYDGESFLHLTKKEGLSHNTVISMLEDRNGDIWIGTKEGLNILTVKAENGVEKLSLRQFSGKDLLSRNQIDIMLEDSKGNMWIGTFGGGVVAYDGEYLRIYDEKIGLSNNYVRDMMFDEHENLWIATSGGGVNKLNPNSFFHISDKEVHSTLEDSKGNIWLGTRHDGILKFDGKSFLKYSVEQGLSDERVYPIMEDREGNIWAGTFDEGVNIFDGQYIRQITEDEGLGDNFVLSLLEDKEGDILIGTNGGGISKYDGTYLTNITEKDGIYSNFDGTIIPEQSGNYWYCGHGIIWSDGRIIRRYTMLEKTVSLEIWSGMEDRNHNLWLSTMAEGVLVFSPNKNMNDGSGTFEFFNEEIGLLSNTVWSVAEDTRGNIWICTEVGLNILTAIPVNGNEARDGPGLLPQFKEYKVHSLLREDGLKGIGFWPNSCYLDGQNRMWLGGTKALSMIDLNSFQLPDRPPRLSLSSIEIDRQTIDYRKLQEPTAPDMEGLSRIQFTEVADFYNYPLDLELPFGMNHITFHFSAIDWAAPHKISYQYRLEGFDRKWSPITEENKAVYRKIAPGSYTFEVRAIGAADIWSETVKYSFVIHPPLYQTTFAYFNYGLLALVMIFGLIRWRTRRIMRERDELELLVRDRTKEIEQKKEEIEQQNDHILETNEELVVLNEAISSKNNEIIDSINYAQRIQAAMLPPETYINELLNENFILYKPRDIVSGDFYWIKQVNQYIVLVAADCTGHGVPGAFMSMLGMSYLNEIVQRREITQANHVLNELRKQIKNSLRQHGLRDESKDGIDMALCVMDLKGMKMQYAGANNPLYLFKDVNGTPELKEIKADRMPLGYYQGKDISFVNHDIQLDIGDSFYLFSDGYIDQKGGKDDKKFMSKNFKSLLLEIHDQTMPDQKEILDKTFTDWMGENAQMDDILVIGVRV